MQHYAKINFGEIVQPNLRCANRIPKEYVQLYVHLKSAGSFIPATLSCELAAAKMHLEQARSAHEEAVGQRKSQSYYQMLHDVYSGRKPRNYVEEVHRASVYYETLKRFHDLYPWKDGTESLFENDLLIDRLADDLVQIRSDMGQQPIPVDYTIPPSAILPTDLELCLRWSGMRLAGSRVDFDDLLSTLGSTETARLLSARIAEKVSSGYYAQLGFSVEDISIQQLQVGAGDEWKDFDLQVGNIPVDVKNARASFSNPDSYVDHCIPRFKLTRGSSTEVRVTGVFSSYLPAIKLRHEHSHCKILGETSLIYARRLWKWTTDRFGGAIRLDGMWNNNHYPSWIFDYPDAHYANLRRCNQRINSLLSQVLALNRSDIEIPPWIFSLADKVAGSTASLPDTQKVILADLHSLRDALGYTRPSLYLYLLGSAMSGLIEQRPFNDVFAPLLPMIFVPVCHADRITPLGLDDPLSTLKNLVSNLACIYQKVLDSKLRFIAFKMTHPMILLGQLEDGYWITVLAYCGGYFTQPFRTKCGASPLVLGIHANCPTCGHLICEDCGYCADGCSAAESRR